MMILIADDCQFTALGMDDFFSATMSHHTIVHAETLSQVATLLQLFSVGYVFLGERKILSEGSIAPALKCYLRVNHLTLFFIITTIRGGAEFEKIPLRENLYILNRRGLASVLMKIERYGNALPSSLFTQNYDKLLYLTHQERQGINVYFQCKTVRATYNALGIKKKTLSSHLANVRRKTKLRGTVAFWYVYTIHRTLIGKF
ncbi:TPA: hypothetical protein ACGD7M_001292 [Serratia marcescens]